MEIPSDLTQAEMSDAFWMNLTSGFWMRTSLTSLRGIILVIVLVAAIVTNLKKGAGAEWESVLGLLLLTLLVGGIFYWRIMRMIKAARVAANAAYSRIAVDARGLTTSNVMGATTFVPWAQFKRWKEGKLVFTVGDARDYRTIPKRGLNEGQVAEVRGLLQTQIRIG